MMGESSEISGDLQVYEKLRNAFSWRIPVHFNMGVACCRPGDRKKTALITVDKSGAVGSLTFGDVEALSNRLANTLKGSGVTRGDRVAVVMPQSVDAAVSHLAIWKLGAISLPLATLFGTEALAYRLGDSGARIALVAPDMYEKIREAAPDLPILVGGRQMNDRLALSSSEFAPARTQADDPAFLIYTSGTTGSPKGALHAHRSLLGHLPGFELYYDFVRSPPEGRRDRALLTALHDPEFPRRRDVIWTPADWAWIGGLMDVLVPAWYFGMPVLTADHDWDPEWAIELMAKNAVTLSFLPPTALKMLRSTGRIRATLQLRAVFTGGESLGAGLLEWGRENFGLSINEGYGQTECNLVVGNCASLWSPKPGSMGRAVPGHKVAVLDEEGQPLVGSVGEVAIKAPDPVMMLAYWNQPQATVEKFRENWLLTGDLALQDEHGYLTFKSRKDDVINTMGYRIGPGEIEECLLSHHSVRLTAVVGEPHDVRGQIPVAFVVLNNGFEGSEALISELQQQVRAKLGPHEVPRRITFVADIPRTTTGKILRRALLSPTSSQPSLERSAEG